MLPLNDPVALTFGAGFSLPPTGTVAVAAKVNPLTINCGAGTAETATPEPTTGGPTATPTEPVVGATPTNTVPPPPPTATVPPATPTTPPDVILGDTDCNGTVNSLDALWVLWLVAALADELPCPEAGDVNEDGVVDATDALWILWIEANLI